MLWVAPTRIGPLQQASLISIIDDDESIRVATASLLRSFGYRAHTFASAEEFLESPNVHETSCLIIDVQMPKMTGIELQRLLRAKGIATPIIFITAFPEDKLRSRALDDVASCMLSKPFDGSVLIECLATSIGANARFGIENFGKTSGKVSQTKV
jgi:FixJ family two-component response regulator